MSSLSSVSNQELLSLLASAVRTERVAIAKVIAHLAELDRRKLYLQEACSSQRVRQWKRQRQRQRVRQRERERQRERLVPLGKRSIHR